MRHTTLRRHATGRAALVAAVATLGLCATRAHAAESTWTSSAGSAWLTGSNWSGGTPGTGDTAVFATTAGDSVITINMGGATNNGTNNQAVGQIALRGGEDKTVRNNSASFDGTITLNGVAGTILSNSSLSFSLSIIDSPSRSTFVAIPNGGKIDVTNAGASVTIAGSITSAPSGFEKTGSGTLVLSATNAYTGSTTLSGGITSVGSALNLGATPTAFKADSVLFNGGTLRWTGTNASTALNSNRGFTLNAAGGSLEVQNAATNLTVLGAIAGSGALTKTGAGDLTLSGSSSFAGGVVVNQGGLFISQGTNLGAAPASPSTNLTLNNGSTLHVTSSFALNGNRRIALGAGAETIDVASSSFTVLGSVTGSGSLVKTGTGTLVLGGSSTSYSGGTEVAVGTLVANNSTGHATGTGLTTIDALSILTTTSGGVIASVNVLPGGTLTAASGQLLVVDGTAVIGGTASGNISVTGNASVSGTLSPGNSPGTFSVGGDLSLSGVTDLEIAGTAPGDYDRVFVTGAITFGGDLAVSLLSYVPSAGDSFDFFDFGSATGTFAHISLPALSVGLVWDTSALYTSGVVSVANAAAPVPLPASAWMGLPTLGLLAFAQYRRARNRRTLA